MDRTDGPRPRWDRGHRGPFRAALLGRRGAFQVNAALHNGIPGDTTYLDRAQRGWNWFRKSGMINPDRMVNDGLDDSCAHDRHPAWTYHQGVVLAGLAELHRATGDTGLLATDARRPTSPRSGWSPTVYQASPLWTTTGCTARVRRGRQLHERRGLLQRRPRPRAGNLMPIPAKARSARLQHEGGQEHER
ncbi:hypothetical protein HET64_03930 [Streptomyces sp. McG3]|nr:hypothetical protein [Streptomyces sp. McG3]